MISIFRLVRRPFKRAFAQQPFFVVPPLIPCPSPTPLSLLLNPNQPLNPNSPRGPRRFTPRPSLSVALCARSFVLSPGRSRGYLPCSHFLLFPCSFLAQARHPSTVILRSPMRSILRLVARPFARIFSQQPFFFVPPLVPCPSPTSLSILLTPNQSLNPKLPVSFHSSTVVLSCPMLLILRLVARPFVQILTQQPSFVVPLLDPRPSPTICRLLLTSNQLICRLSALVLDNFYYVVLS